MKITNMKYSTFILGLMSTAFFAAGCFDQTSQDARFALTQRPEDIEGGRATSDALPPGLDAIVYLASDCSHCEDVMSFIKNNGIDKKINVTTTEAFKDKQTYDEFINRSKNCGMDITQIGTPMLWDGKKCYRGADKIFEYLGDIK